MKPIIIVCDCGKVKKFGEFITMPRNVQVALEEGTYKRQYESCNQCKLKIGRSSVLF